MRSLSILLVVLHCLSFCVAHKVPRKPVGTPHYRDYFYVGHEYVVDPTPLSTGTDPSLLAHGQMYVEHLTPAAGISKEYPLVIVPGGGMTGTNFLNTPDGRMGWADWFMGQGYEIYIVEQPSRARSAWLLNIDGPQIVDDTYTVEWTFTATERFNMWPNATLHTQWPGNGSVGDPIFDHFFASMVPYLSNRTESATKNQRALINLVEMIGPVHLLTHSQAGSYGWSLADARPDYIRSLTALEPSDPPFISSLIASNTPASIWGITDLPLNYVPPLPDNSPDALNKDKIIVNDPATDQYTCYAQSPPLRTLPNLATVPIHIVVGGSSWQSLVSPCIVRYLNQAGVPVEYVRLQDVGLTGHGHMSFMEKGNIEILEKVVGPWIQGRDDGWTGD